jgi:putative flippase GtrA
MPVHSLFHRLLDAWQRRALILKAASFATVGFVNSLIDFGVFWIAVQYFGVPLIPANVLSWLVAITNSFVMNSLITFVRESGGRLHWRTYARFAGVGVIGLVVNTTTLLIAFALMPRLISDPVHQLAAAKACAIAASFLVNFSLSNFVVFRRLERDDGAR